MPSHFAIRAGRAPCLCLTLLLATALACAPRERAATKAGLLPGNASALDYLDLLGLSDRIRALPRTVDGYSDFLARHPESSSLPRWSDFKAETILALRPTLVISDATQAPETRDYLERVGVPVVLLEPFRDLASGIANLERIAKVLDLDAGPVIRRLQAREKQLQEEQAPGVNGPRILPWVYYGESHWTAGRGTGAAYAIDLAGGRDVAVQLGITGHQEISIETILDADPDVMLISDAAMEARLRHHPRLEQLRCIQASRIVRLSPSLASCNSPYLIEAAVELRRQLRAMGFLAR